MVCRYGVTESTIRHHIQQGWTAGQAPDRVTWHLSQQQENDVVNFVLWMADHHQPLTTTDIVQVVSKLTSRKSPPSLRWAERFVKKKNLSLKKPNIINHGRAAAATEEQFDHHFHVLEDLYSKFNFHPSCIVNMNETGWSKDQQQ